MGGVKHIDTMAEIILYITKNDSKTIVEWINSESEIAWIVKEYQKGKQYRWKAANSIESLNSTEYRLWKIGSGPLRIPSGNPGTEDSVILNPFQGWEQTLKTDTAEVPWFGVAAPETFGFKFNEKGKEADSSIGRSGFTWIGNYFGIIGISAPDDCKKWWERLKRYIKKNATGIPWPGELGSGKTGAYAFPEAYQQLLKGRLKDINP